MTNSRETSAADVQAVLDLLPDAVCLLDELWSILAINDRACDLIGVARCEAIGRSALDFVHSGDHHEAFTAVGDLDGADDASTDIHELRLVGADGVTRVCEIRARLHRRDDGSSVLMTVLRDVDDNPVRTALAHRATHDELTGVANRHRLMDRLSHALAVRARTGAPTVVAFIDVDRLKEINDNLGHVMGDHVLCEVADRLQSTVRATDTVARYGGDEFVVVLEASEPEHTEAFRRRVAEVMDRPLVRAGVRLPISVSMGLAVADDDSEPRTLLEAADAAMYLSKHGSIDIL